MSKNLPQEVIDEIARRIADPGSVTPRGDDFRRSISQWGARAVSMLFVDLIEKMDTEAIQENQRLSAIIDNMNTVNARQAAELSMKNGHLEHAKEIYLKRGYENDRLKELINHFARSLGVFDYSIIQSEDQLFLGVNNAITRMKGDRDAMKEAIATWGDAQKDVEKERDELRDWKESALVQLDKLDVNAVGKLLGLPIGIDVMSAIQPAIEKLIEKSQLEKGHLQILLDKTSAEIEECRDNILHQRHQLEGGVLGSDQINAVLDLFDDSITQPVAFVCNSCNARVDKVTDGDCDVCRFEGPRATPAAPVMYDCVCGTCKKPFTCRVKDATMCDDCCPF